MSVYHDALVHLGHSIGHTLGAQFHIPHGIACSAALPEVIEYAARTECEKVRMVCEAMGKEVDENASWKEVGETARLAIRTLAKSVGMPNLEELSVPREEIPRIAGLVTGDTGFAIIPYRITAAKIGEILNAAYSA